MNNQIKFQIDNCTFAKTILMLTIIAYHSCVFWTGNWHVSGLGENDTNFILCNIANWLNSFHVYAFTLISGYLFYYLKVETRKYTNYFAFVRKKVNRLIIPYLFVGGVWVAPIAVIVDDLSITQLVFKYILCVNPSQLWFLWMLFDVFLLIWPICDLLQNSKIAISVSIISWGIGFIGSRELPNIFCVWTAFNYIPFFILGLKLKEKDGFGIDKIPVYIWIILDIGLFVILKHVSINHYFIDKLIKIALTYTLHVVGAIMAFSVLQKLATMVDWKNSKCFDFLSKCSMTVYLLHQQIIYFVIIILNGWVHPYIIAITNFVISLSLSLILSSILMRFKMTRLLIGER